MFSEIDKLRSLYAQYDTLSASGEDVVADLRKEINNLELAYLKKHVFPQVSQFMALKVRNLRCAIDCSFQFDGNHNINYSFCSSGAMLFIKDKIDTNSLTDFTQHIAIQSTVEQPVVDNNNDKALIEDQWINKLLSMKGSKIKGLTSPHKAIFILTIIECIKRGYIQEPRISATNTLSDCFTRIWNKFVPVDWPFCANAFQPYIHMSSEPFYYLVHAEGIDDFDINQNWSRSLVVKYVEYAYFDKQLFELLHKQEFTERLSKLLIDKFIRQNTSRNLNTKKMEIPSSKSNIDGFSGYRRYLSTLTSNIGRPYSVSSINVYVTALRSKYMQTKVYKFTHLEDGLEVISDLSIIDKILNEVKYDSEHGIINRTSYLALKMFRDYCINLTKSKSTSFFP